MSNSSTHVKKQVNNLCAKIKTRYPHLYQETGGKLIRKTLLNMLEVEAESASYDESPSSANEEVSSTPSKRARVIRNNSRQQQAA
jgi:hypothetical protein